MLPYILAPADLDHFVLNVFSESLLQWFRYHCQFIPVHEGELQNTGKRY